MTRRILQALLAFVLMVTAIPIYPMGVGAAGEGNRFVFDDVPETVNYKHVTLEGTLNRVSPNGISYTVTPKNGKEGPKKTTGIVVSDDGSRIRVANIELFPGLNTITFYGKQGSTDVSSAVKITYIDTPLLYNLQFKSGTQKLPLNEKDTTFITEDYSSNNGIFTLEGNAPNVTKVVVDVNGESYSAFVNDASDNYFIISQLKLEKGKNILKFKLTNNDQIVESKREVVYFDGTATFYNAQVKTKVPDPTNSGVLKDETFDLNQYPVISAKSGAVGSDFTFTGEMMIPTDSTFFPTDPASSGLIIMRAIVSNEEGTEIARKEFALNSPELTLTTKAAYHHFKFSFAGNAFGDVAFVPGKYSVTFEGYNPVESNKNSTNLYDKMDEFGYTIKDGSLFQIINAVYSQNDIPTDGKGVEFNSSTTINNMPFAIGLEVINAPSTTKDITVVVSAVGAGGGELSVPIEDIQYKGGKLWFKVKELPLNGTQDLKIKVDIAGSPVQSDTYTVQLTSASGPVQEFTKLIDGAVFNYDPTELKWAEDLVRDNWKELEGTIANVDVQTSHYTDGTITLLINNGKVDLSPSSDPHKFKMTDVKQAKLIEGQNIIVFRYKKGTLSYEKTYKITLLSNNYPEIPKENTEGIYPYGTEKPSKDDRFTGKDGIYTTKEKKMNIFGTFDFIDLGKTQNDVEKKLKAIEKENETKQKYILEIVSSDGKYNEKWVLGDDKLYYKFGSTDDNWPGSGTEPPKLEVRYIPDKQYFTFNLTDIELPKDGSKLAYTFTVYNNGTDGSSKATYRLEVSAPGLMYDLVRPILPRQGTINQNFVEVVIDAPAADSVTIGKNIEAKKVNYDGDMDGDIDYPNAFRAIVTDLKPNKANKITFTIKSGAETVTGSFEVFYALSTIPGSQYMAPMEAKTSIFEKQLSLTFPKDTYLVRYDYDVPVELKTQVFKGHNIMYGIANNKDGVVDRFDYLPDRPKNFDDTIKDLGRDFERSFDTHFIKASNVFWMDAGLADDPGTSDYDPYQYGMLPIMPGAMTKSLGLYNFNKVPQNRILIPNKRGTLELEYNENIVNDASNHLTVMRYDPNKFYWENLGGKVNTSKKTITVPFDKFGYYVVAKLNDSFPDVSRHQYARNHLDAMFAKGVIKSDNQIEFKPDMDTTRGEFAAMVVRALQLPLVDNPPSQSFVDVPFKYDGIDKYDYRHIETAARLGIVRGKEPKVFDPEGKITREEAAVILARALKLKTETNASKTKATLTKMFKDAPLIDPYAGPSVAEITKKKLIVGSPVDPNDPKAGVVFEPKANMLRGDAAILMARVMAMQKLIPPVAEVK
ncbi:S-layer homology domain-containing protein [Brevibacillus daliensis]|uniref:S-layer homology domain-containing protein n=1 Tax=Brevibacillus daliensis TaxID=2892995 RepID=UPI001E51C0DE|nr:S-layer homology domain-containing protein [Brevibacillus daliensis]